MKKIFLILGMILFVMCSSTKAQREYWGTASGGGNYCYSPPGGGFVGPGGGVLFKTDKTGHNEEVVHMFDSATGFRPIGSLTLANNGKLYGVTNLDGINIGYGGVLFEFDPVTNIYTLKVQFNNSIGGGCEGTLLNATNGKLYGICSKAIGAFAYPLLFEYDPLTGTFTIIHTFLGFEPYPLRGRSQLMQASNGKIYIPFFGGGGVGYQGALYEFNPVNNSVTLLYTCLDSNGSSLEGPLLEYGPDNFYGTFTNGDNVGLSKGGIFQYNRATNTQTMVARFDTIGGVVAFCGLTRVGNKLYGATYYGGYGYDPVTNPFGGLGILFEFDPANNHLKKIYEFSPLQNYDAQHDYNYIDATGWGTDLLATNGLLYGLTGYSMFSYNVTTSEFTSLFGLSNTNGYFPQRAKLIEVCTKPRYVDYTTDTISVLPGNTFSFTIHSNNSETFHWQHNGIFFNDIDSILNFNPFAITDTGKYVCELTNECGTVITKVIYLKVAALPVGLLSFTAILQSNRTTLLQWQTSQEYNNDYFEIERNPDSNNFTTSIGRVYGNGTTALPHSYQYTDIQTPEGTSYYRLRQVDYDGQFTYSRIAPITNNNQLITVITSSQAHTLLVNFSAIQEGIVNFKLFASNGQLVKAMTAKNISTQTITTTGLASGVYELQVIINGKLYVKKIIW